MQVRKVGAADDADLSVCRAIRRTVFIEEQQIDEAEEWDDLDGESVHLLARRGGADVGTARLRRMGGAGKAERVAVLPEARRLGVGAALMSALEHEALRKGLDEVVLHAQESSVSFYRSLDYQVEGERFEEAGIPHRRMRKRLGERA